MEESASWRKSKGLRVSLRQCGVKESEQTITSHSGQVGNGCFALPDKTRLEMLPPRIDGESETEQTEEEEGILFLGKTQQIDSLQ